MPYFSGLTSFSKRSVHAVSALLQRLPNGRWTNVFGRVPGGLGAYARFIRAKATLTAGEVPLDLCRTIVRLLNSADSARSRHMSTVSIEFFDAALQLAYHPTVHMRSTGSPLASDPEVFLAPFRNSVTARTMLVEPDLSTPRGPGGPRVLVVSHGSWTFINRVIEQLKDQPDVRVEILDLSTLPSQDRPSHRSAVRARAHLALHGSALPAPASLKARLNGIDTLFVEWGTYTFAWLSLLDLGEVRLVCRLHRFEAFTPYPALARFTRVDDMLFISPSVRELVRAEAPRLNQAKRIQTVRNPHNYEQFSPEKVEGFEKTLLQVGWSVSVKDPFFTFDVLEALRHEDPQWRLLLVGPEPPVDPESREIAFICALQERLAALGSAVEVLGKRDDVPAVMHRAGFIISSSRHEGTHESIAEGAAAGCIPVVRNWPDAARWGGGARSVYPDEWVVESVAEAVARIRSTLRPSVREVHVRECIDWVDQNRRSADVLPPYLDAIHGR